MQGFDLDAAADFTAKEDDGTWVAIDDQQDEPMTFDEKGVAKPVEWLVVGAYSKTYRDAERAEQDAAMKGKSKKATREESEARVRRIFAKCVKEWRGVFASGKPLPCTTDNVAKVLAAAPWIYEKHARHVQDHARFFTTASAS